MTNIEKKVSEEKLIILRQLQSAYSSTVKGVGELRYQELLLNEEQKKLDKKLLELEEQRKKIVDELQNEFGSPGTVNIETGIFTPTN